MNVNVVSLFRTTPRARDWNNQELAEFYRVETSLIRAGLTVETDRGLSDEGDPWFVFCRADTGDIIIHFARFDGFYAVASPAFDRCMRGADFRTLIEALIETHPLVIAKADGGARISIHPAALLVALVMTCFFKLSPTKAFAGQVGMGDAQTDPVAAADHDDSAGNSGSVTVDERHSKMLLTAIAFAVSWEDSGAAADSASFAGPGTTDVAEPVAFTSHSANADGWLNPLDDSGLGFDHQGQAPDHAQPVVGVLSFGELGGAERDFGRLHAMLQISSIVTRDSDHLEKLPPPSFRELDPANTAPQSTDQSAGILVWHPAVIDGALGEKGGIGSSSLPHAAGNAPDSLQEVASLLGSQASTHLILDMSGGQPQVVLSLVEHTDAPPATHPATASGAANQGAPAALPDPASTTLTTVDWANTIHPGIVSSSDARSPAGVVAFEQALESFMSAHPDYRLLSLPKDVFVYDSHLSAGNANEATISTWTFADGSHATLVGVAPHATPLG